MENQINKLDKLDKLENKLDKLEIKGITIHFCTEQTQEGYVENCRVMYNEGVGIDNMAVVYKSVKSFYEGDYFEKIKENK